MELLNLLCYVFIASIR